ncbi:transposon Ty3-I Gag-Pol polyprotein [Nephila pilipes]|uniref:Transposon Ty3-I Gag-Pol polyprotein n=1 Tax=Nephila pilipes TaxID=299642 RepID=A0A8X6TE57_NEPPI|nr:transposon Ty3-I Gag-Pol polyprotein [Nephila pilipes]
MVKTRSQATMADSGNAELNALLAEMKKSMEAVQEEMRIGQEEMKKGMEKGQDEMRVHVETQVEGIKEHVITCIGKIEEDVQSVKKEINEVKSDVQEKISFLEKRLFDLEDRPINYLPSSEVIYSRPTVKYLTFDGQTSWSVFKAQFVVASSSNGWTGRLKASQLVASLRGSAAEVLQGIPAGNLKDLTTIERALESLFGDSNITQFYRTELKTRRQKPGESLQVLAANVERLMSLAYAECPLDIRESLAAQYFIDAIRDENTQHSTRMMDAKDLKSALAYSMKYEAERTVSKTSNHVRSLEVEDDSKKKEDKFESLFERLEKLLNNCITEKKNATRQNSNVTCWQCNRKGHLQRDCQAISGKLCQGRLWGRRLPFLRKAPVEGLKISALSGKKNGLYLEGLIWGLQLKSLRIPSLRPL